MTLCAASAITFSWSGKRALILNRHALPRDAATWGAGQLPMAAPIRLGSKRRNKAIAPCSPYGFALVARIERSEMRGRSRLRIDSPRISLSLNPGYACFADALRQDSAGRGAPCQLQCGRAV